MIVLSNQIKTSGLVPARFDLTTKKFRASSRDAYLATPLVLI